MCRKQNGEIVFGFNAKHSSLDLFFSFLLLPSSLLFLHLPYFFSVVKKTLEWLSSITGVVIIVNSDPGRHSASSSVVVRASEIGRRGS